ncbi:alpha-1,2-fucosyltransferase, partial [Candidatus Falkowbacteria bacterium]|nr:alpha-1,2-fucosyltransferase [Candidatus Falkowbacteria bacterium]
IALRRGEDLKLDKDILGQRGDTYRAYGLDNFNIRAEIASREEVLKVKYPYGLISKALRFFKAKFLRIFHIGFEARMLKTKARYLEGFFQSYKYLESIRRELLEEISLKEDISLKYGDLLSEFNSLNSVALHIRRGDYVNNPATKKAHFICDLSYYQKAISLIKVKLNEKNLTPKFFVFSDDINWAKENFKLFDFIFVSRPEFLDPEELILMSKAKHNIISNSSFSFWSAWLNNNPEKIVIAPALWNRKYRRAYKDLIPEDWLRVQ